MTIANALDHLDLLSKSRITTLPMMVSKDARATPRKPLTAQISRPDVPSTRAPITASLERLFMNGLTPRLTGVRVEPTVRLWRGVEAVGSTYGCMNFKHDFVFFHAIYAWRKQLEVQSKKAKCSPPMLLAMPPKMAELMLQPEHSAM